MKKRSRQHQGNPSANHDALNRRIVACDACERLRQHCADVAVQKRAAYRDQQYWGKPVPNFGDPQARVLIVGLAPGAHGANRTGRMFTGDRSGDWLFRALYQTGFANQAEATDLHDGLQLSDCLITAACHCAPPGNKPSREELQHCARWLEETFRIVPARVIVALGRIAWDAVWRHFRQHHAEQLLPDRKPDFGHGQTVQLTADLTLLGSYHPSQQNTFTGRLTETMLKSVFRKAARLADNS